MVKIAKIFNAMVAYGSSKGIYVTPVYDLELYKRALAKFFSKNFLSLNVDM